MEIIDIVTFINLVVVSPLWIAIAGLRKDIRELRQNQSNFLLKLLEKN